MLVKRQEDILAFLSKERFAKVEELAEHFQVSIETIRRDLIDLEKNGAVQRVRGGAVFNRMRAMEEDYSSRIVSDSSEKRAIARVLCDYIKDGDSIAMNNGSSNLALARELVACRSGLTVVTNSPYVGTMLNENDSFRVYLTGGLIRKHNKSLIGGICCDVLDAFKVDKTILNIDGLSVEGGVLDYNTEEAAVARMMCRIGKLKIIIAEYKKFEETAFNRICRAEEIDYIFTDWRTPPKTAREWKKLGVEVVTAPKAEFET